MQGGDEDDTPAAGTTTPSDVPPPDQRSDADEVTDESDHAGAPAGTDEVPPSARSDDRPDPSDDESSIWHTRLSPVLPAGEAKEPPAMTRSGVEPAAGSVTWYRSDQERHKSVRRRANPWYRRVGRSAIALVVLGGLGVGLYFGARLVQDYIDRDRLPSAGADVPDIRSTSFQIRSSPPAPELDGTLTIDQRSLAFEFVGRNGGSQAGIQVVSPDGTTAYIRRSPGGWAEMKSDDLAIDGPSREDLLLIVRYLSDDTTADAILTNRLRREYVDLVEQETEGVGENELTRYELELDTLGFSNDYPAQWLEFQGNAIPGVQQERALPVVIWLDSEDVLVRVRDEQTNWSWQRLTYSEVAFTPIDPVSTILGATTEPGAESDDTSDSADG